jgi:hypothetical protein
MFKAGSKINMAIAIDIIILVYSNTLLWTLDMFLLSGKKGRKGSYSDEPPWNDLVSITGCI